MFLKGIGHMFSNKLERDIDCCICFWWRGERKTSISKGLGWNWNLILSGAFSYSAEFWKPIVTMCKMHSVRNGPFLHSKSITAIEDN